MSDTNELVERLTGFANGTFHYKAYRGKAPDGVPQLRSDILALVAALAPVEEAPVAYLVISPDDDYYGKGPDSLQFHPLSQRDLDAGYSQRSLYAHPPAQAGAVPEAEIKAFRAKYREIFPGSHPDRQTIIELLTASKEAVAAGSEAFRSALAAASLVAQTPPEGAVTFYDQNNCPVCHGIPDYFGSLVDRARDTAAKASTKFPQPNYVTLKIAEEAGEVVRGAVHYAENRMEWKEVEGEIVQLLAMLIRFVTEGDQINGITPPVNQSEGAGE